MTELPIFDPRFLGADLDAHRARMAFMHTVQSGHTSLKDALLRIFEILSEGDQVAINGTGI